MVMQHQTNFIELVEELRPAVNEINTLDVKLKLDQHEPIQLIDVREDHEWQYGHIPSAIHLARVILERDIDN